MCKTEGGSEQTSQREGGGGALHGDDRKLGTVPSSCHGHTLISVTRVCFTSLLINWNAAPTEIELGTVLDSPIVPAGQRSENTARHSCHFPNPHFNGVSAGDIK